jgi:cyclohexanecarboxylate-CoA ligase/acyl-CoA synthetase
MLDCRSRSVRRRLNPWFRAARWWRGGSAGALLDHWGATRPTERFVSDGTIELDFATTRGRAYRLAATLLCEGVRAGARVVAQLPNGAESAIPYIALARLGAVLVPIMTMVYRATAVRHVLRNVEAVTAITAASFRGTGCPLIERQPVTSGGDLPVSKRTARPARRSLPSSR